MTSLLLQMPLAEIIWEHSAPKWLFVFMSVVALAIMAFSAIRYMPRNLLTPVLALLRIVFLVVLGWCLMMPLRKEAQSELVKPRFVIALDTSASMAMSPTSSIPTRWETAQDVLKMPWKQMIAAQCEIDTYPFADSLGEKKDIAKTGDLKADGQSTRLHQALAAAMERYQGQPLAGVLLLSDGLDTRETTDEWVGMKWPCPVYAVRLEKEGIWEREVDVAVESVETPARVIVGWASKLTAVVAGQGTKGETLHVQLFRNGELQQDLPTKIPAEGGSREVTFQLENKDMGSFTYTVSVPPLAGETTTNNNTYSVSAQVVDAKNRVLYIEDVPRWESKYLTRVLRSNPAYTPLVFLRGPEGKFLTFGTRGDTTLHFTDEQLAQFKMVILGDLDVPILTDTRAQQMVKYVEGGGSLILLGGQKSWGENGWTTGPMAKMLPIKRTAVGGPPEEGTYAVKLTEEGKAHPVFQTKDGSLDELPAVLSLFPGATPTPGASVLANATGPNGNTPLIVLQRYGQGKVVVLMTDSLWRWQMEPGKDKSYVLFWNQLLAWLAPQEDKSGPLSLDLYASEDRVFLGDSMTLNARVGSTAAGAQAEVKLEVEEPGGRKIPFTMQRRTIPTSTGQPVLGYGTDFDPKVPGLYKAVAKATLDGKPVESEPYTFFVKPFTPETNPKPARADLLQAIARASQGRFCEKQEIDQVLSSLTFKAEQTEKVIYNSLWNNPWLLSVLVLLLTVEWMTRRLRNMA